MTVNGIANTYEEDLGISKISKSLTDLTKSENNSQQKLSKFKSKSTCISEPRRSSRVRNPVQSYCDDANVDLPPLRKRSRSRSSSWTSYAVRPLDEVKLASYEERVAALKAAEELQSNLQSENPCFVKSMVRSHVYSCFWLGLPTKFCEEHLSSSVVDMTLEDESGQEFEAIYIGKRTGLSGGWRAFALDHKLDDGDALVFELIEPTRFKVYIIRASMVSGGECDTKMHDKENTTERKRKSKVDMKLRSQSNQAKKKTTKASISKNDDSKSLPELSAKCPIGNEIKQERNPTEKNGCASQKLEKKGRGEVNESNIVGDGDKGLTRKPRRKPASRSFRKRA
ncbi:putative B3 domain-containing protein At5g58280 isoform X2 [Ziziphus jujuba]|uniref:B3 domain-containing protein At5g58280 isoform X2 n=1 Tax=Ziziphus jujuba TaxID=326968 RepID=A0ABM3IAD7_ZIZJJ|nr:putative B3 domain-containing protein At5g58280 isoform X2 [Ziziphus jujuba]